MKKQVCELAVLGYSTTQIATDLGMGPRQIRRYLEDSRSARAQEQLGKTDEIIGELIESQEKRLRYLFGIIKEGTKNEKMKALALLQQEDQMKVKRHQLAGNLPTEAPIVAIQNTNMVEGVTTIADAIRVKCPELINRFKKNKGKILLEAKKKEPEPEPDPWEMVKATSSNVLQYAFNLEENKLRVWFKSSLNTFYEYNCTPDIFKSLKTAKSVGSYISHIFKGKKFDKKPHEEHNEKDNTASKGKTKEPGNGSNTPDTKLSRADKS